MFFDFIGQVNFDLDDVFDKGGEYGWFALGKRSQKSNVDGDILIDISYSDSVLFIFFIYFRLANFIQKKDLLKMKMLPKVKNENLENFVNLKN